MENPNPHHGMFPMFLSMFSATFAWIKIDQAQPVISFIASLIALLSGVMAIRYYYFATKKVKL